MSSVSVGLPCVACALNMAASHLLLTAGLVVDTVQHKVVIWETSSNATEKDKKLAWSRIAGLFGLTNG